MLSSRRAFLLWNDICSHFHALQTSRTHTKYAWNTNFITSHTYYINTIGNSKNLYYILHVQQFYNLCIMVSLFLSKLRREGGSRLTPVHIKCVHKAVVESDHCDRHDYLPTWNTSTPARRIFVKIIWNFFEHLSADSDFG